MLHTSSEDNRANKKASMSDSTITKDRRIDVWGHVLRLWEHKWVWLAVFAITAGATLGLVLTRPSASQATQLVQLTLPPTTNDAEATQQAATLTAAALTYVQLATTAPYTDEFVSKHPEFEDPTLIGTDVQVQLRTTLLMEFASTSVDKERAEAIVHDLAHSFTTTLSKTATPSSPLTLSAELLGDPTVIPAPSNRSLLLAAGLLLSAALATIATATRGRRRSTITARSRTHE